MSIADAFLADLDDILADDNIVQKEISSGFTSDALIQAPSVLDKIRHSERLDLGALSELTNEVSSLSSAADLEIFSLRMSVEKIYSKRFKALGTVVGSAGNFLKCVAVLGWSEISSGRLPQRITDELSGFLPRNEVVALSVAFSSGPPVAISREDSRILDLEISCALELFTLKENLERFLEKSVPMVAPNLSSLLGPVVAGRLLGASGGLRALATMPSQNLEAVGAVKRQLGGLGAPGVRQREGVIWSCDLIQDADDEVKTRAVRLVVGKAAIAARSDAFGGDPSVGKTLREQVITLIGKAGEKGQVRQEKILPVPEAKPSKKRGGRRARALKAKYGASEFVKQANRVKFGQEEEQVDTFGQGVGMAYTEKGGRLRGPEQKKRKLNAKPQNTKTNRIGIDDLLDSIDRK